MGATVNRCLGAFSLAILLVSTHYGLGFLLGTAEQVMIRGVSGSLYAVSIGLGTLALLALVKFYWNEVEQIWTLLGKRYGQSVKIGVGLMSWTSLIGIEAVQIIAAASILNVAGVPTVFAMVTLTSLFAILSLLPVERASWVFRGLLLLNLLALVYALVVLHGVSLYWEAPLQFIPALPDLPLAKRIGVSLPTILLVLIDMKCQQFIVQAKDVRTAYWGCLLAALVLFLLAFLPTAVVMAAQTAQILPMDLSGKEVIPYILTWIGGGANRLEGRVLIAALAVPALGLGSNVLRIQTKTILDLEMISATELNRIGIVVINALLALTVAFRGGEIINLILCFYAAYLSTVWVPFIAFLLAELNLYHFSAISVRIALLASGLSSLVILGITILMPNLISFFTPELIILLVGLGFGSFGLCSVHLIEKLAAYLPTEDKTQA